MVVHVLGAVPPISILYRHPKNVRWPFFSPSKKVGAPFNQLRQISSLGARLRRTCFPSDSDMVIMLGNTRPGKLTVCYWKSLFLMGKSTISMVAMLNYQRVTWVPDDLLFYPCKSGGIFAFWGHGLLHCFPTSFQMLFVVCPSVHPFWGLVEVV